MDNKCEYDKINGDVFFIEESHKYGNIKMPWLEYISVTTIIDKYFEDFDKDFWSSYKAIERIVGEDVFKTMSIKKMLLNIKKWKDDYLNLIDIDKDSFLSTKNEILEEYRVNNLEACERGTAYHLKRELAMYDNPNEQIKPYIKADINFECEKNNWDLNRENAILPEYLIYYSSPDGLLNIAGQVDLVIKEGNDISIFDYKSNRKGIEKKAYFDKQTKSTKKMFYPINNIPDTTFNHYALQLSFYAYMLKQINPEFNIKQLKIIHDAGEGETEHIVPYLDNDVKKIIDNLYSKKTIERERDILSQIAN